MEGKIIKPQKQQETDLHFITPIILFLLGIVLVTNSNQFVTIAFEILGALFLLFGIYQFYKFFSLKKQFKTEDSKALMSGTILTTIGLLIILLAGVLEVGLRYLIGIYLILSGVNKIASSIPWKETSKRLFCTYLLEGIILLGIGLYTIFFANAALIFVGILMIISAIIDLAELIKEKK